MVINIELVLYYILGKLSIRFWDGDVLIQPQEHQ